MWNRSSSPYLVCYHGPKDIIECYEFDVELITQTPTSMHGSKEGHAGYIYRRSPMKNGRKDLGFSCDPYYKEAWEKVQSGLASLKEDVDSQVDESMESGPIARSRRQRRG
jgi:hypothetical protein